MSATPLTDKALQRLRAICEGNGIDLKKIEFIGTEESDFTLKAEMLLSVDVTSTRAKQSGTPHAPKKGVTVVGSVTELASSVTGVKTSLLESGDWIKEASEQLQSQPGQGFGIERAEITLDNLSKTFQATQNCEICHGQGSSDCEACKAKGTVLCKICQGIGQETCYQCQGTGKNINAVGTQCPTCHGRGNIQTTSTQNCPQCAGRGNLQRTVQQNCPQCHGSGRDSHDPHQSCHGCGGRGSIQVTAMQTCEVCHGRGQMQTTQSQSCTLCHGRGTLPPTPQQQTCLICNGLMRIMCRTCMGKKEIPCPTCDGKGKIACVPCNGMGKFTVEETALPVARCEFRIRDAANAPSTLRHALDRFGFKMLVKLGAKISFENAVAAENKTATMNYTAEFPFAEMRLRINGKPMRAGVVGEKASIRDILPFLDPVFDAELKKLEKKVGHSNGLDKALKLRAMRELFELVQAGGDVLLDFRKLYPVGFSTGMMERMKSLLDRLIEASTFTIRATVAGIMLLLFSGGYYMFLISPLRAHLAKATFYAAPFILDAVICALSFLLINLSLRLAAALHLRSMAPKNTGLNLSAQRAGSLGIGVSICTTFIYVGLLWFLKATPGFFG